MGNKQKEQLFCIIFGIIFQTFWITFQQIFVYIGYTEHDAFFFWFGMMFVALGVFIAFILVVKPIISFILRLIAAQILIATQKNKNEYNKNFSYTDQNNYSNPYNGGFGQDKVNINKQNMNGQSMNSNNMYGNYGDGSKYR